MVLIIIIAFASIIGLLVLHEFGHFIIAKKFGVKVEEFGVGIPPRIFGKKFGDTVYSLNLLPIGAFVKLYGEEKNIKESRSFTGKPIWQRSLIILGGVVSFWIIAAILLTIVFAIGAPQAISDEDNGNLVNVKVQILAISSESPVAEDLRVGDIIRELKIKEESFVVNKVKEVQEFSEANKGNEVVLVIQRGQEILDVGLVPRVSHPEDEGPMGLALVRTADVAYPLWQAPIKGAEATVNLTGTIVVTWGQIIKNLVSGEGLPPGVQVAGPIGIGVLIGQAAQAGINYFLQFIAIIAVYLAIFNILPIPALDGGKLMFLGIEKLKGSPVNEKIEQRLTAGFFFVLIALMVWITIKDIGRLF